MLSRTTHVKHVKLINLSLSSSFQIGDTSHFDSYSRALAVQEADTFFSGDPEVFEDHKVFTKTYPFPVIYEDVSMTKYDKKPTIEIGSINVITVAAASLFAIGNVCHARSTSRILNIRRLVSRYEEENQTEGGSKTCPPL